jgi:hypothetical protein
MRHRSLLSDWSAESTRSPPHDLLCPKLLNEQTMSKNSFHVIWGYDLTLERTVMWSVCLTAFLCLTYYTAKDLLSDDNLDKGLRPVRTCPIKKIN